MSNMGKTHIIIMWTVGPEDVAEGDRIFASHGEWMKGHPRDGDEALLSYTISKGPELSNPLDPTSDPTGKTIYVLDEYYESPAGVPRHWQDAMDNWQDLNAIVEMECQGHGGDAAQRSGRPGALVDAQPGSARATCRAIAGRQRLRARHPPSSARSSGRPPPVAAQSSRASSGRGACRDRPRAAESGSASLPGRRSRRSADRGPGVQHASA